MKNHKFCALFILPLIFFYLPYINESLWIDELMSTWTIETSWTNSFGRSLETQGFGPFFTLFLKCWSLAFGISEVSLRFSSLSCLIFAAYFFFLFAQKLVSLRQAQIATVIFLCVDEVINSGLYVRPYALALLCFNASLYFYLIWLASFANEGGQQYKVSISNPRACCRHNTVAAILFALFAYLTIQAQYLFLPILVIYFLLFIFKNDFLAMTNLNSCTAQIKCTKQSPLLLFLLIILSVFILCLPNYWHLKTLTRFSDSYRAAYLGGFSDFVVTLSAPLTLPFFAISIIILFCFCGIKLEKYSRINFLFLLWYILPSFFCFILSLYTGKNFLLERYYVWNAPGLALLISYFFVAFTKKAQNIGLVTTMLVLILFEPAKFRFQEDWRSAITYINNQVSSVNTSSDLQADFALLVYSGMSQSENMELRQNIGLRSYFLAPLEYYKTQIKHIIFIPCEPGQLFPRNESERLKYWHDNIIAKISDKKRIFTLLFNNRVYTDPTGRDSWVADELASFLKENNFSLVNELDFKRIRVGIYEK